MSTNAQGEHDDLRVSISVLGRFHAFDLARQLQRAGVLDALITSYPASFAQRWDIDRRRVRSLLPLELARRALGRVPGRLQGRLDLQRRLVQAYDALASRQLRPGTSVVVGWAGMSRNTLRRARELGARTVVERGSTHIRWQTDVLRAEHERWGVPFQSANQDLVERELEEYEEADRIAIPSTFVRDTFISNGTPPEKLIQVPYGVSTAAFGPLETGPQPFRIIHCGAISLRKGVPYLLQAFVELDLPDAELWLVGPVHPEMPPLLARFQHPAVKLKGAFPQGALRTLYAQCAVFCLASIEEGLAMTLTQAMACGLPVIYTRGTGGDDIARDGVDGLRVAERDPDALKAAILTLYADPERRRQMGRAAAERAASDFSWERYGRDIIAAYRELAGLPARTG